MALRKGEMGYRIWRDVDRAELTSLDARAAVASMRGAFVEYGCIETVRGSNLFVVMGVVKPDDAEELLMAPSLRRA